MAPAQPPVCSPIPIVLEPGGMHEVVIPIAKPSLAFGILIGDRRLELVGVFVGSRPLPHALVRLVDGTRFAGLPATLLPVSSALRIIVQASVRISAELEVLIWQDHEAASLLERAGARSVVV